MTRWHQKSDDKSTHELVLNGVVVATLTDPGSPGLGQKKATKPKHRVTGVILWDELDVKPEIGDELRPGIDADTLRDAKLRVNSRFARHGAQRYIPASLTSKAPPKKAPTKAKK